jgi:hypothetical protein
MIATLRVSKIPAHVFVQVKLPGRKKLVDLGLLRIENEVLDLPLPLAFLCHADEDKVIVRETGDRLEEDGIVTWFAPNKLLGGADWKAEIDDAIRAADFVVVFLSKKSINKKGYFQKEVKRSFELREELPDGERFIIPVLLDDCELTTRFEDIHWLKLSDPDGYDKLREALKDLSVPA